MSRDRRRVWLCLAVAFLVGSPAASGQDSPGSRELEPLPTIQDSARIRIWVPEMDMDGDQARFLAWDDSSLHVVPDEESAPREVAFPLVSRIDRYGGTSTGLGVLRGAGIGLGVGGLIGLAVGLAATSGCDGFLCGLDSFDYMAYGSLAGAGLGGVIGANAPVDQWSRLDLPQERGFGEPQRDSPLPTILGVAGALLFLIGAS